MGSTTNPEIKVILPKLNVDVLQVLNGYIVQERNLGREGYYHEKMWVARDAKELATLMTQLAKHSRPLEVK